MTRVITKLQMFPSKEKESIFVLPTLSSALSVTGDVIATRELGTPVLSIFVEVDLEAMNDLDNSPTWIRGFRVYFDEMELDDDLEYYLGLVVANGLPMHVYEFTVSQK